MFGGEEKTRGERLGHTLQCTRTRAPDMNESRIYQRHRQRCPSNARGPSGWDGGGGLICLQQHRTPFPFTRTRTHAHTHTLARTTTYTTRCDGGSNDFHVHYSLDADPSFVFMIRVAHIYTRVYVKPYMCENTYARTHIINGILCVRLIPIRSAVNNNCGERDDRGYQSDSAAHVIYLPHIPKRGRLYPRPRHDAAKAWLFVTKLLLLLNVTRYRNSKPANNNNAPSSSMFK